MTSWYSPCSSTDFFSRESHLKKAKVSLPEGVPVGVDAMVSRWVFVEFVLVGMFTWVLRVFRGASGDLRSRVDDSVGRFR